MPEPQQSALVGDKYELLRRIGAGGMGEVWEARHHVTGRRVAVKLLRAGTKKREEATKRFLREAQAIGRLEHTHVVEVLDAGIDRVTRSPYIVQSLLRGVSLRRWLRTQTRLSPLVAASIVAPVLRGLSAAHVAGIVHRDIKPSNVILSRQPEDPRDAVTPKIIDFGISKLEEDDAHDSTLSTLTASGVALGTVGYMAPEQAEGRDVDGRADLWAVGVMLFEMVAGRRPFDGGSTAQVLLRIVGHDAPSLATLGLDEVPRGFVDVVARALARRPSDRYLSALDMLEALEGAVGTPLRSNTIVLAGTSDAALLPDEELAESVEPLPAPTGETLSRERPRKDTSPQGFSRGTWIAGAIALALVGLSYAGSIELAPDHADTSPAPASDAGLDPTPDAATHAATEQVTREASAAERDASVQDLDAGLDAQPLSAIRASEPANERRTSSENHAGSRGEPGSRRSTTADAPDASATPRTGTHGAAILSAD